MQRALTSAGNNSEDINKGIGWTPKLDENTNKHADTTLDQFRRSSALSRCQESRWSETKSMVANIARLNTVPAAEREYKVLLGNFTNSLARIRDDSRRTRAMMIAAILADCDTVGICSQLQKLVIFMEQRF